MMFTPSGCADTGDGMGRETYPEHEPPDPLQCSSLCPTMGHEGPRGESGGPELVVRMAPIDDETLPEPNLIDSLFRNAGAPFELRPRPVTQWIRALRDWTNVTLDITESRAKGEISPYVILPQEDRDLTLLVQASLQHQLTEATVRGDDTISIRLRCEPTDIARVVLGLRVFTEFALELVEEGRLKAAPEAETLSLLAEVADELATD